MRAAPEPLRPSTAYETAGAAQGSVPLPPAGDVTDASRRHLRGSSLLLAGRMISVAVNFAVQVLIVRYLTKADFGVFAYALAFATMGHGIAALGLDKSIARFLPIYDEQRAHDKLLGALVLVTGTVLALGLAFVVLVFGLRGLLAGSVADDGKAVTVLLILILLTPIQAFDDLLLSTFAVFSKPRQIFFRKHVVGPGLRLAAVLLVIASGGDVRGLAFGYVLAGALGVALFSGILVRTLRAQGLLGRFRPPRIRLPARELYGFALPLLAVDLLFIVMNTTNVVMLGHFGDATDVADYRVVQPLAHLNMIVMTSFTLLFTPLAARLFARGDRQRLHELYWRSAVWIAVWTFPVFAATVASAGPLTVTLFGERYASSATILALLSVGYYLRVALGFNALTLRVFGLVRYIVVISLLAAALNVALNLALIPRYGALGAGIAACATFAVHTVLNHAGLRRTGIRVFDVHHLRVYGVVAGAIACLLVADALLDPGLAASAVLVIGASTAVLALTRRSLRIAETFPELMRVPLLRRVVP